MSESRKLEDHPRYSRELTPLEKAANLVGDVLAEVIFPRMGRGKDKDECTPEEIEFRLANSKLHWALKHLQNVQRGAQEAADVVVEYEQQLYEARTSGETQYGVTDRHPDTDVVPLVEATEEEAWEAFDRFTSSGGLVLVQRRLTPWEEVTRDGD